MYPPELERLIELALVDEAITSRERAVILKKAASLGIDQDEIEMVIDARLQELARRAASARSDASPPVTGVSQKQGSIRKCPACGASLAAMLARCADCGHELTDLNANASIQKLFQMLEKIEESGSDSALHQAFLGPFATRRRAERKCTIIEGFPIPNTREDLLEFLAMAIPRAGKKSMFDFLKKGSTYGHEILLKEAWTAKCTQVIVKARIMLKGDTKALDEIEQYAAKIGLR